MNSLDLPFELQNDLERRIGNDPAWQTGVEWGRPRHGHPEGTIKAHIAAVLANIDRFFPKSHDRNDLRFIALVHDSFKYQVNTDLPRCGENHHAMIARRFAERFTDNPTVLDIIELHDEAYNAWQLGNRDGKWDKARTRAERLLDRLGPENLELYLMFYRCDNSTEGKSSDCFDWFQDLARQRERT